jgi:hypothetical protein
MLTHLRQLVQDALAPVEAATLSTTGPAGLQARLFPCQAMGLTLYLLVPSTSDHLFNLEYEPAVAVTTAHWQLAGNGRRLLLPQAPADLGLAQMPEARGCDLVAVTPTRLQINRPCGWGYSDTIDIDEVT